MTRNSEEEGIRTLEAFTRQHAFQACALNRSATSLYCAFTFVADTVFVLGQFVNDSFL